MNNATINSIRRVSAVVCYVLAALGALMLIKTEARKWFVLRGDTTSVNTYVFWISGLWTMGFALLGQKLWPTKKSKSD